VSERRFCPALFIGAPGSSHGKTTLTAALARFHAEQGRKVTVFKSGPDFIDPTILERASGQPVYQLDLWMAGAAHCRRRVYDAARDADLILIEGVMGLFDGRPCSADLAEALGVPVLAVIDASGSAQTLGALAHGLATYRAGLPFAGVLANSVASARHEAMIIEGMPASLRYLGSLPRSAQVALPARHLGLVPAQEIADLDARLSACAALIAKTQLAELPAAVEFGLEPRAAAGTPRGRMGLPLADAQWERAERAPESLPSAAAGFEPAPEGLPFALAQAERMPEGRPLAGVRIGIARDPAFSFIYPANLDLLRALGAELAFFSPLADATLPEVDSLYLPGGYPELHLQRLAANVALKAALHRHAAQDKPLFAECGGMLYLLESLTDKAGQRGLMAGVLPGHAVMHARLQGLGYQSAPLPGGVLRGHTFHHSIVETPLLPFALGERLYNTSAGERIFRTGRLIASYIHGYFPSNPAVVVDLFKP
jgi:cobyrinic acid a,c-diamide synthase